MSFLSYRYVNCRPDSGKQTAGVARTASGLFQTAMAYCKPPCYSALSLRIFVTRGMGSSPPTPDTRAAFELRAAPLAQISTRKQLRTYANLVTSVKLLEASANLIPEWGASSVGWPHQGCMQFQVHMGVLVYLSSVLPIVFCSHRSLVAFRCTIPFFHSFDSSYTPLTSRASRVCDLVLSFTNSTLFSLFYSSNTISIYPNSTTTKSTCVSISSHSRLALPPLPLPNASATTSASTIALVVR